MSFPALMPYDAAPPASDGAKSSFAASGHIARSTVRDSKGAAPLAGIGTFCPCCRSRHGFFFDVGDIEEGKAGRDHAKDQYEDHEQLLRSVLFHGFAVNGL